ncbi:receptor protein kinase-like protein ZAR1 [Pyrus x bretschneideri]|uniref:receptor protein kinase-like protein ZAR1 n=1 Tax=Pyrus x bretschneideri TaxID=225117 RepID=UPI00202EE54A|nr:receptor protein kinase-like protein ZAR1 [Pyrus x bretschneideri]
MILFFLQIALLLVPVVVHCLNQDGLSLLALKSAIETDPTRILDSWSESDPTPCHWHGVACTGNRVTDLLLTNKRLTGYIPSELGHLDSLKRLNLSNNNFSMPIPAHLFNAAALISLDLSNNSLVGPIPDQIRSLKALNHLDLSSNLLNGFLPESLAELPSLAGTLNLSYNKFSGGVPASYGRIPVLVSLDLRHNNLTGKVPQVGSLANQGPTAFSENPSLCGIPLDIPCPEAQNPDSPKSGGEDVQKPLNPDPSLVRRAEQRENRSGVSVTVPIISGVSVVVGAVSVSVWLLRVKSRAKEGKTGKEKVVKEVAVVVENEGEGQNGTFVVVDEGFELELEDLLRASAYVVGKSRSGITYRVVAGNGGKGSGAAPSVVAVRRLSEGDAAWRFKEFEAEAEAMGKVVHPNIVRLRAYYYANDEKLLVTDFIRNGSLYNALHGKLTDSLPPLPWTARLKIAQGIARGLVYIHEHSPRKYVHGSIKSTKILLNDDLQPYISGFGLARLMLGTSKFSTSASRKQNLNQSIVASGVAGPSSSTIYLAPEARVSGSKFTQKCDVYSFGVVLMEILTGRLPDEGLENGGEGLESLVRKTFRDERPLSEIIDPVLVQEVHAKKQVVEAFHIALNCTELDPELRPRMKTVSESLDRIRLQC